MGTRWRHLLAEVGRFLTVGGVATIVALFLFNLLVHGFNTEHKAILDNHVFVAYVLANTVGMVISYRGSRNWAFRDRPPRQADGGRLAFFVINVATMSLPIACLAISRDVLGLDDPLSDNVSANVIGLFLGLVARFCLFRAFVFKLPIHLPHLTLPHLAGSEPHEPVPGDGAVLLSEPTDSSRSDRARPPAP